MSNSSSVISSTSAASCSLKAVTSTSTPPTFSISARAHQSASKTAVLGCGCPGSNAMR